MSEQQTDDQAERGAETMNDRSLELVIREQLTAMGVSNAYHRAAAIAKAIQSSEEPTPAFFTQLAADAIDSAYRSGWNEAIDRLSALPDPAPRGLSEEDAVLVDLVRACGASNGSRKPTPLQPFMCKRVADLLDRLSALPDSERPEGERTVLSFDKYEAEKVMDPILRRWFAIDLDPVDAERNAENAAVDLSWHLENVGLLNRPTLIDEDGVEHICHALIEVGPWDEIDGDGTEASIIADHIRDLARLLDAAPVGLTEAEQATVQRYRDYDNRAYRPLLAIIDRLSAAPVDDRERVPEGWRVEWTPTPELEFDPPADVPRLVRK